MNRTMLRWIIIILTVTTAIVHLALGIGGIAGGDINGINITFVLNGLGYFALLAALFVPNVPLFADNRALAHYLMIGYAAVTFVLYFVINGFSDMGTAAIISKVAEALLVIATFSHMSVSKEA